MNHQFKEFSLYHDLLKYSVNENLSVLLGIPKEKKKNAKLQ